MLNEDVNWVEKRDKCCGANVFRSIKAAVLRDIDERNKQLVGHGPVRFSLMDEGQSFNVVMQTPDGQTWVNVSYEGDTLKATSGKTGATLVTARVVLGGGSGVCKLAIADDIRAHDEWYFRYLALDALFFGKSSSIV